MPRAYTRIPLDVKPDFAAEIDKAIARLTLKTGERMSRTAFIVQAVREKLEALQKDESAKPEGS
mgnify:CR=1 FL=1